ncbi:MAG TPA: nucleotidyltransferase family protein [Solirubrobacteraceae bacterium]|jgi:hypothetical protein|nr:nucleotidyltransferase family protein [Solirubrobacteraceae bacterium]
MTPLQAQQQLILLAASTAERRRRMGARAHALASRVDWSELGGALATRRLLPTLGPRIVTLAGERVDEGFATAVERSLEAGRRQAALLSLTCERVGAALAQAGIDSAPLKGPALGEAIYGDPGRRPSSDVDVLVTRERLHDAAQTVRGLGYAPPADHLDREGLPLLHLALVHERGELPPVELHWRVHWYERSFAEDRLLRAGASSPAGRRPAPIDELTALLLFYARDGFLDLRLACDVGAWWDTFGKRLTPGALVQALENYPKLARVLVASAHVAEKIVGLPAQTLIGGRRPDLRGRIALRMATPNPHGRSQAQLHAEIGLIDGLLAPAGGGGAFARRQLLPPRAVLSERAQRAPQGQPISPVGHAMRVLRHYGPAFARLVRTPETLHPA